MYVPRQVGVFFLLLFFLKVASFACIDGMCSNFILQVFFFLFSDEKKIFGGGGVGFGGGGKEEFEFVLVSPHPRVPSREDVLQRYYEHSVSLLEKLRNKIFRLAIAGHLPFKCYVL